MTRDELGMVLGLKPSYIKYHWPRIKQTYAGRGIKLIKLGRGEDSQYGMKLPDDEDWRWDIT